MWTHAGIHEHFAVVGYLIVHFLSFYITYHEGLSLCFLHALQQFFQVEADHFLPLQVTVVADGEGHLAGCHVAYAQPSQQCHTGHFAPFSSFHT